MFGWITWRNSTRDMKTGLSTRVPSESSYRVLYFITDELRNVFRLFEDYGICVDGFLYFRVHFEHLEKVPVLVLDVGVEFEKDPGVQAKLLTEVHLSFSQHFTLSHWLMRL